MLSFVSDLRAFLNQPKHEETNFRTRLLFSGTSPMWKKSWPGYETRSRWSSLTILGAPLLVRDNEILIFTLRLEISNLFFKPALLVGVQNLIKKQEAVDSEITAHEQLINTVMSTADQLIEREHYAADEIEARCADLQEKWAELTSLSATRQQNLQESQKAQQVRKKTKA